MFRKIAALIYTFKWPVAFALILITMVLAIAMGGLSIDPSMETLFIKDSPEYLYYREYSQKYGSDQMIALAMSTPDLFSLPNLQMLKTITDDISKFSGVERVVSLANAMDIRPKIIGIKVVPALEGVFEGQRTIEELRGDILHNELYVGNLVSKDGKTANLLLYLKPTGKNNEQSKDFIEKLRAYLASREMRGIQFYLAGSPVEQHDFIELIQKDQMIFIPLIAILLVVTTFLIYRSIPCMILSMSIVLMTLIWTMGTIALLGKQLNLMTSLLGPVIMIVAVVNSIYLINVFFEVRQHQPSLRAAIASTMEQLGEPCFLTHFVAVLGFISLALNKIPAIQSFGTFAALGTFYSYVIELILTPLLFQILPYRASTKQAAERKSMLDHVLTHFIERLDFQGKWLIMILTFAVIGFSIAGLRTLEVDTNIVKQMKPDLPLAVSTRFIDKHLTGVYSLGFVLRRRDGGSFADTKTLQELDAFKDFLESKPEISKVNGITTVIKKIHEARHDNDGKHYKIPESQEDLDRYFKGITESGSADALQFLSADMKEVRLEARMRAVGTTEGAAVEEAAREYLKENMRDFKYEITGSVVLLGKIAKGLVHEQIHSFSFALGSIILLMVIIFRSIPLGLLAAIPNLIPILAVYGLMGFLKIELSTPTAMISSIVLGLVVDASIQFLYRFRLEFKHRQHYLTSLHHTCRNMGQSMFVSTMILVIGFASSVFASFRPTIHFGVLTSLTIFFAFVCTLIVLPVCILIFKPFGRPKLFRRNRKGYDLADLESIQSHFRNRE